MPLNDTPSSWNETDGDPQWGNVVDLHSDDTDDVEQELEALQRAVAQARRHAWTEPDPIEPELENFLAALSRSHEAGREGEFIPEDAERRPRRNSWREVLEDVG